MSENPCLDCGHAPDEHDDTADAFCTVIVNGAYCDCRGLHLDVGDCIIDSEGRCIRGSLDPSLQSLIDTGAAWKLEGAVGRAAMAAIEAGEAVLGPEGHYDYWGNYVPSRYEVVPGTKGSPEYAAKRQEELS